jgi:uncharacterized protein
MDNSEIKYMSGKDVKGFLANSPQITFEVTDACNLRCEYCGYGKFYGNYDKRENNTLPIAHAKSFIDYLSELWKSEYNQSVQSKICVSFYGGEPLLNMPFIQTLVEYIEKIDTKQRQFSFNMTTNGMLLNRYMDYLVEKDIRLLISLDGAASHNSYRIDAHGNNSFSRVFTNINLLKEKYPLYFERNVGFNAVLHNRNTVSDIYSFFNSTFSKIASISALNTTGIKESMHKEFMSTYQNVEESLLKAENYTEVERQMFTKSPTYQTAILFLQDNSEYSFRNYNELLYGREAMREGLPPTGTCWPFTKKIFLTVNGKILPCERIGQTHVLGSVNQNGVQFDFDKIADYYNHRLNKLRPKCIGCYRKDSCKQCILCLDSIEDENPLCHGFMNKKEFEAYKNAQLSFFRNHPEDYARIMNEVVVRN